RPWTDFFLSLCNGSLDSHREILFHKHGYEKVYVLDRLWQSQLLERRVFYKRLSQRRIVFGGNEFFSMLYAILQVLNRVLPMQYKENKMQSIYILYKIC